MKIVIQRVMKASLTVEGKSRASINQGLVLLVGIGPDDVQEDLTYAVRKIKGNRPAFTGAAQADLASHLYDQFNQELAQFVPVQTGIFGSDMQVSLTNDGPVTILLDTKNKE